MQFRRIGRLMKTAVSSIATLLILLGALLAIPPSAFAASGSKFSEVAVGINHSCALTMKGRAYCWGNNDSGQLGDGNYGYDSSSPVAVVGDRRYLHISAGYDATCAISTAGAAYCWGYNDYGQLGNGTHDETIRGAVDADTPQLVSGEHAFTTVSVGWNTTCGLTAPGDAYCWGYNDYGQVGNGAFDNTEAGLADADTPQLVSGGRKFLSVSAGENTTCGVTTREIGYCWGTGNNGELGNGDYSVELAGNGFDADSAVPVKVSGKQKFVTIATGGEHSCGLTTVGKVYCWGDNTYGQIGARIAGGYVTLPTRVKGSTRYTDIAGGNQSYSTCGITATGAAKCWGYNGGSDGSHDYGVLGADSTEYQVNVPISVSGALQFTAIDIDDYHACGLTTKHRVYCWGYSNGTGMGGTGLAENTYKPTVPIALPVFP